MEDYSSNSNKEKEKSAKPEKDISKVITGKVQIQKKSLGQKFKDVFVAADFKSVTHYVIYDICIPAFQNMLVDSVSKGIERITYGDRPRRSGVFGSGPRVTYQSPVRHAGYGPVDNLDRRGMPPRPGISTRESRGVVSNTDIILASREDSLAVLEGMSDILEQYDVVTVVNLNKLLGNPSTHVDEKWGWTSLEDVQIRSVREGFLLDLPRPQPIT